MKAKRRSPTICSRASPPIPRSGWSKADLDALLDPALYTGRSVEQVETFVKEIVDPLLTASAGKIAGDVALNV